MIRVSLAGFGRIGRDVLRQTIDRKDIQIVSISDTADKANLIYLLKYDSIYGRFEKEVVETENGISIDGTEILFNKWKNAEESDWSSLDTDVLILATGKSQSKDEVNLHISKGCRKVIVASTPSDLNEFPIYIPGANDNEISFDENVISLGSNTANAVCPILKELNNELGVERAFLTTVHGYSNSNRLADVAGEGFRLNRAAGENIIPSITKSSEVIETVLPFLKNKVASSSMTVPIPDGSTVDLTIDIKKESTIDEINNLLQNFSTSSLKNIIGITYDPIVSSDVVKSSLSGLVDGLSTMSIANKKIKLIIWFDNGWGYSARIIDTIEKLNLEK
jgi:glyceraldehyde 3-phosphate dehydrogenase